MNRTIVRYNLPSYWASYLINQDASSLSEAERQEADSCLTWIAKTEHKNDSWWTFYPECIAGYEFFSWSNDWNETGGMVCTYVFSSGQIYGPDEN
jgi:hypothetical protein